MVLYYLYICIYSVFSVMFICIYVHLFSVMALYHLYICI